jgi:hypothetical protein
MRARPHAYDRCDFKTELYAVIPEGTNCYRQSRVAKNYTDLPTHPAKSGMLRSRPKRFTITGAMFRVTLGS